ncbi:targeting protein for Xklp2-like [Anoplolepis gracilipes]|uniref:targeting protein for Xklp2-like n=1 Tax=Anoplolepis gracilipes TaxID=354296 RepID=UPI003BA1D475
MAEYCNLRAPQWIDFAQNCSPVQIKDFFEKEHTIHERIEKYIEEPSSSTAENMENTQPNIASQMDVLSVNPQAQADLDIIKSTPVKVISPKYRHRERVVTEATYDQVFNEAVRKLELCTKVPRKDILNKSTQEPKIFKTPNLPKITKSSRSVGSALNKNTQSNQNSTGKFTKINKTASNYMKKISVKESLEQDKNSAENDTFKKLDDPVDESKDEKDKQCNKDDNKECKEENNEENNEEHNDEDNKKLQNGQVKSTDNKAENNQDTVDAKSNPRQSIKHATVLTWQNHRRSNMHKRRTSVNKQYIGLAEAVSRFQTETPKRFRTRSNKDNTMSPSFYALKLTQNRLKPTVPISPALISKNRVRPVTVLSQEEREMQEIEKMKKNRIKANPIPANVLRGPRATTKINGVAKKQMVITNASALQPDEKIKSSQSKSPHRDKSPKNTVTKVVMTNSEGIIVEHEEMAFFGVPKNTTKNVTRVVPFSFEARNKALQTKKELRLKNMKEASEIKAEFHARPAPNFSKPSKPSTPSAKQQQNAKSLVVPSPFSFEERNKKLSEKKEQLVKQMLDEGKRSRVFRANPAPVFKPVMIRGKSKEHLPLRNKSVLKNEHNVEHKCENQENREPNEINTNKAEDENTQRTVKNSVCNDDKPKGPLKALPLELNTDKRVKERRAFDENLKRKELEEEMKRQEEEKKQLEHEKQLKAELRKLAEVKAKPMPKYKLPIIAKSTKELTNPQSPAFASKLRAKQKYETS